MAAGVLHGGRTDADVQGTSDSCLLLVSLIIPLTLFRCLTLEAQYILLVVLH